MRTISETDTTSKDAGEHYYYGNYVPEEGEQDFIQSMGFLEDYPGKRFEVTSTVERGVDWKIDALDLTPY